MRYHLLAVILLLVQFGFAQEYTQYLDLNTTIPTEVSVFENIVLDDCVYIRETVDECSVYLYKEGSRSRKEKPTYLDGTQVPTEIYFTQAGRFSITPDIAQARLMKEIVDNAFSTNQADSLKGINMFISLRASSTTGEITDVYFHFVQSTYYENIPIEVFRSIEKRMKNELHFNITDFGRKLTYSSCGWAQCPKGREDSGMTIPEDGGGMLTMPGGKLDGTIGGTIGTPSTTPTMP